MFVISSEDFNQAYKRILYLKQYISFRKSQVEKIKEQTKSLELTKNDLAIQKDNLVLDSEKKLKLSENKKQELFSIAESKEEKRELIVELSKSEKKFTKQIKDKKKQKKQLDDKLRKIIDEEIRRARREAKNTGFEITPEVIALSAEFNENKGKLPWPLEKGVIVQRYGKQNHAVFGAIETFNNGIDIATEKNAAVRAVFDGTISRIFFIKGEGKAVLMNHGEYFSVYSGLQEVGVKVGEKLLAKEKIGVVFTQELDSKTELHFEIWKGYEKHDPSKWLYNTY
jgi:septal ring factor EnvC (AmiA/AmiB activator)